jgi:hypothetical protein
METITKHLEEKLQKFTQEHAQATQELNRFSILVRKYEGAIETIQLLLNEMKEPEKELDKKMIGKK